MSTGMFPLSGVPPTDAINSIADPLTKAGCAELWYSTSRCQPRFDPAAANAMLAELINLINGAGMTYDCTRLDQVYTAARYLIQKGLPRALYMSGGPNNYTGCLDPVIQGYNDFMTLTIVPNVTNNDTVTLDLCGKGAKTIRDKSGSQLPQGALRAGIPEEIAYYNGSWYLITQRPPAQTQRLLTLCSLENTGQGELNVLNEWRTVPMNAENDPAGWGDNDADIVIPEGGQYDVRFSAFASAPYAGTWMGRITNPGENNNLMISVHQNTTPAFGSLTMSIIKGLGPMRLRFEMQNNVIVNWNMLAFSVELIR